MRYRYLLLGPKLIAAGPQAGVPAWTSGKGAGTATALSGLIGRDERRRRPACIHDLEGGSRRIAIPFSECPSHSRSAPWARCTGPETRV
jgi:hypothetical protein